MVPNSEIMKNLNRVKSIVGHFIKEEDGIGVVEIILILVILIGLVVIFGEEISRIITNAIESISGNADSITD